MACVFFNLVSRKIGYYATFVFCESLVHVAYSTIILDFYKICPFVSLFLVAG